MIGYQKLLFKMPKNNEVFIAAYAAVTAYVQNLMNHNFRTDVYLVIEKENWLTDFLIPPNVYVLSSVEEAVRSGVYFDLVVDLASKRAASLVENISLSMAHGYGLLLGFDYINELVKIRNVPQVIQDVCILQWSDYADTENKFQDKIRKFYPDLIVNVLNPMACGEDKILKLVLEHEFIIGKRSTLTYLAASARRQVLELYPLDEYPKSLFAKWSNPRYLMFALNSMDEIGDNIPYLWRSFERGVHGIPRRQQPSEFTPEAST